MMIDIRCAGCQHMEITGRAEDTRNNAHLNQPRGRCFCRHPEAIEAFQVVCPQSRRMAGFIAFTRGGTNIPDVKTAPRWCPLKLCRTPHQVDKATASQIITTFKPRGMFYLRSETGYTGIDNRSGDAWCETFRNKAACLKWLTSYDEAEDAL